MHYDALFDYADPTHRFDQVMKMMHRTLALFGVAALAAAAACRITIVPGDDDGPIGTRTPLDRVRAEVTISQDFGENEATVTAELTGGFGFAFSLSADQSIEVNNEELQPRGNGVYRATVPLADDYVITVREPTRGVEQTTVAGPPAFAIASPTSGSAASLSGFEVVWTGADDELEVEMSLSQTAFNRERTEEFGPVADEGQFELAAADLSPFVQGALLRIEVQKTSVSTAIAGLGTSTLRISRIEAVDVIPAP